MPSEQSIYSDLLESFPMTLQKTSEDEASKDVSGTPEVMTTCQKQVVSFDSFKKNVASDWGGKPHSCDALYRYDDNTWFLIEFKNGTLENTRENEFKPKSGEFYGIIRKLFESLFLLTERLGQTIEFTRKNLIFILVYNEDKNQCLDHSCRVGEFKVKIGLTKLGHRHDTLQMSYLSEMLPDNDNFNISYFDKLYVKKAYICSKKIFENEFVKKFANESC